MRLVLTPDNPAPPGGAAFALTASDGIALRGALFPAPGTARGTVLLCGGRTEFIEKYFEYIAEWQQRGFAVLTFDWRGQGLSQRLARDPRAGHVARFADFDLDLDALLIDAARRALPKPWILFGHSMGGHLVLRNLPRVQGQLAAAIVTAPMCALRMRPAMRLAAAGLARLMTATGRGEGFTPGGDSHGADPPFAENRVTRDPGRYARNCAITAAEPALRLGAPSYQWVREAFASMAALRAPGYLSGVRVPVLGFGAGADQVVAQGIDHDLVRSIKAGAYLMISDAEHEIVQERDIIRAQMWALTDTLLARLA